MKIERKETGRYYISLAMDGAERCWSKDDLIVLVDCGERDAGRIVPDETKPDDYVIAKSVEFITLLGFVVGVAVALTKVPVPALTRMFAGEDISQSVEPIDAPFHFVVYEARTAQRPQRQILRGGYPEGPAA